MTQLEANIYNTLKVGHENAIPGGVLANMFGVSIRQIRKASSKLILNEKPVCNYMDGKGYFKPASVADIEKEYAKRSAFIKDLLKTRYRLKKAMDGFIYEPNSLSTEAENTEKSIL